jgi:hypothetical protein
MMHMEVVRVVSFAWGVVTWYGILLFSSSLLCCLLY